MKNRPRTGFAGPSGSLGRRAPLAHSGGRRGNPSTVAAISPCVPIMNAAVPRYQLRRPDDHGRHLFPGDQVMGPKCVVVVVVILTIPESARRDVTLGPCAPGIGKDRSFLGSKPVAGDTFQPDFRFRPEKTLPRLAFLLFGVTTTWSRPGGASFLGGP